MMRGNNTDANSPQYPSRKWKLVMLVVILATAGAFLPPLVSVWLLGAEKPLVILSGTEFVSLITLVVSAYFGVNVWQKHVERRWPTNPEASGVGGDPNEEIADDDEDDTGKEA
jgi:hypothetical protein